MTLERKDIELHDIAMSKYENLVLNFMKKYNMVHRDEHTFAEQKSNYRNN